MKPYPPGTKFIFRISVIDEDDGERLLGEEQYTL